MSALEQARTDIGTVIAQIVAAWTAYPLAVEMDNRTAIDQSKQVKPYLKVEIVPISGTQADMADHPLVRQMGQIRLYAVAKGGSGQSEANQLLDFVTPYFDMKNFSLVRTHAVQAAQPRELAGWWWCPAVVNYWYHRIST